jgi:predicted Zn finger-like uncharacterized protein
MLTSLVITCKSCHSMFQLSSSFIKPTGSRVRCSKCQTVFKVYPPNAADLRRHRRVKTQNLISYFSFNETGKLISEGIGRALNISKDGLLLETPYPIESEQISLMAADLEENIFEINGRLVYSKKLSTGMYQHGIAFVGSDEEVVKFIVKLVREHNYRKSNLFFRWYNQKSPQDR